MENSHDHIAKKIVEERMQEISRSLIELAQKYDFHFSLNWGLLRKDSKNIFSFGGMMNENIDIHLLSYLIDPLIKYRNEGLKREELLGSGRLIVACLNDRGQEHFGANRVIMYGYYEIQSIHLVQGQRFYWLKGMDHGETNGWESFRFTFCFNNYITN